MASFQRVFAGRGLLHKFNDHAHKLTCPLTSSRQQQLSTSASLLGKHVTVEHHDQIAVVKLDSPDSKVNSLSVEVQKELSEAMHDLWQNDAVKGGVVISGKPSCFIAGADIKMLTECKGNGAEIAALSAAGQDLLNKVAASPKPIVAAIKGSCLGGGLEVALACQYRIAVKDKKTVLALPEVMLGLLPGAGGTQRLPRLVPLMEALPMMLQGTPDW